MCIQHVHVQQRTITSALGHAGHSYMFLLFTPSRDLTTFTYRLCKIFVVEVRCLKIMLLKIIAQCGIHTYALHTSLHICKCYCILFLFAFSCAYMCTCMSCTVVTHTATSHTQGQTLGLPSPASLCTSLYNFTCIVRTPQGFRSS